MSNSQEEKWLLEEKYGGTESTAFRADLEKLKAGEPLAYLIGHTPFLDCEIYLDSHPLIPRVETEYWVEKAIAVIEETALSRISASLTSRHFKVQVLDLCAGSGCIGVAVAKAVPEAQVTFSEIDPAHLPTIEKNLTQNLSIAGKFLESRFQVIKSDLFENVVGRFDSILTNPPYIDPKVDRTETSVKNHEPHLALFGDEEGLSIIKDIVAQAPKYLSAGGQLWIEHEPEQVEAIHSLASHNGFSAITHEDQYGVKRFSILLLENKVVA